MTQEQKSSARNIGRWVVAALVAILIAGATYTWFHQSAPTEAGRQKVRIGYLPIAADLPLFVASEKGLFSKRGLEVEMVRFESSPLMGTAFVNRSLDAAASIAATVAFSTETRDPGRFRIFMVDANTPEAPLSAMLTLPASGITKVEDLRKKKVGIFPGSNAALVFGLVLKKHGLDPKKDLTLVELPAGSQLQALAGRQIDALCTWEPIATQAILDYKAVNFYPAAVEKEVINPYNAGVWLVATDYVRQHPAVSRKLIEAFDESLDYMRNNPGDAKKSLVRYASIAPHVADKMEILRFWNLSEVRPDVLQRFSEIVHEGGLISKRIDVPPLLFNPDSLSAR